MRKGREDLCHFTSSRLLKEDLYKFFPLPMEEELLNQEGGFEIRVALYAGGYGDNRACLKARDFSINIIKTSGLKLGFTRINGGKKLPCVQ